MTDNALAGAEYKFRVAGVYATRWRYHASPKTEPSAKRFWSRHRPPPPTAAPAIPLKGTRFDEFEQAFRDQLPRLPQLILAKQDVTKTFKINRRGLTISSAEVYVFALPSDQVVAALVLDCAAPDPVALRPAPLDRMLDELTDDEFTVDDMKFVPYLVQLVRTLWEKPPGEGIENFAGAYIGDEAPELLRRHTPEAIAAQLRSKKLKKAPLHTDLPERHEVLYLSERAHLSEGTVDKLLYRRKARHQKEFNRSKRLTELTSTHDEDGNADEKLGIVTTRSSLIQGHTPVLESSVLLSTVQAVGTLARFRDIWDEAFALVQDFRRDKLRQTIGTQTRDDLEILVDKLGNLEFDLTFSVEFPLMRIESFHNALSNVLDVTKQAARLGTMFEQLSGSVKSEITAIDIREARDQEIRHQRNEWASQLLAFVGIPVGVLLAFFGINATEVSNTHSIRDYHHYKWAYLAALLLGLVPAVVLWVAKWLASRRRKKSARRRAGQLAEAIFSSLGVPVPRRQEDEPEAVGAAPHERVPV